jgi:hypothetical protein
MYAVAPRLPVLVAVREGASDVTLVDLELRHTAEGNRVDVYYTPYAALTLTDCARVQLERVRAAGLGGAGFLLNTNASSVAVLNSAVESAAADGIVMGSYNAETVHDVVVRNCLVNDTGRVILGQPGGIRVKGDNVTVDHCTVGYNPYAGIMAGWQTGESRVAAAARSTPLFTIAHNHVHDYGLGVLSDFGGIYLSSLDNLCFQKQPETCWLASLVHDNLVEVGEHFDYGSEGVYMDEQVSGVTIENNTVRAVGDAGIYFHCGADHVCRNNIIATVSQQSARLQPKLLPGMCNSGGNPTWPDMGDAIGFSFERNIVLVGDEDVAATSVSKYDTRNATFNNNVYWAESAPAQQALTSDVRPPCVCVCVCVLAVCGCVYVSAAVGADWLVATQPSDS